MSDSRHFEDLVDDGRFDDLLREVDLAGIAAAWVRYQHLGSTPLDHPDWWAVDLWMDESWWADEARVREGILAIVEAAADADVGIIGAAIMEVFISPDEARLAWLEEQAGRSDRFRRSLANVYVWGEEPSEVARRVEAAAGVRLPRPRYWRDERDA